jgi:hypothetical protein
MGRLDDSDASPITWPSGAEERFRQVGHSNRLEKSKLLLALTALGLVSAVALLDVLTGYEAGVSSLYLVPVALASWTAGRTAGIFVSVICAGALLGADLKSGHKYTYAFIPVWNAAVILSFFIVVTSLVTSHRRLEEQQEARLQKAIASVKTLRGLLPVCAWCKKIRDDHGYWNEVEAYIAAHSEADFTHGICPDCAAKAVERARSGKMSTAEPSGATQAGSGPSRG